MIAILKAYICNFFLSVPNMIPEYIELGCIESRVLLDFNVQCRKYSMDVFNIYTHAHSEHYFVSLKQAILNAFHFLFALFYRPCREKKCIYCFFFTTNIVIDVAVKFEISSFSRNQAKNMRENKKNSNNNNSATE